MRTRLVLGFTILTLLVITGIVLAQTSTCELDVAEVVTVIETVCSNTGNNELCYGNEDVSIAVRDDAPPVNFDAPGDITDINYIQSLYLSALNQAEDIWGVAQMRLLISNTQGSQSVTLLLYGQVEVDNAVEPSQTIMVATTSSINIRSTPSINDNNVIASAPTGTELQAVGRMEDTSWIRVIVPETEAVGWLSAGFIEPVEDGLELEMLDTMESDDTYFSSMQAFYINTGTNISCDNVASDGLIIQTPEGSARVTILINEVTIELISPPDGSATAVIQANPEDGMTVNLISGQATVTANGSSFYLSGGLSTNIDLTDNLQPEGPLSEPVFIDEADILNTPALAIVPPDIPMTIPSDPGESDSTDSGTTGSSSATAGTGAGTGNPSDSSTTGNGTGNATGNANGTGNGTGTATGNANGTGSNNSNGNGNSSSNSNGNSNGNANGNSNGNGNGNSNGNANGNSNGNNN